MATDWSSIPNPRGDMAVEITADEALLWLRSYHAETVRIARDGMAAWRDLNECMIGVVQHHGSLKHAPPQVQQAHAGYVDRIERCRKMLAERATTD